MKTGKYNDREGCVTCPTCGMAKFLIRRSWQQETCKTIFECTHCGEWLRAQATIDNMPKEK